VPTAARVEPARPALAPAGALLRIDLKANEATWVSIYENDKLTFAKVIEPGQSKTIESSAKIRLQLGNAGGVELAVNGKPVGALGRKGQVRIGEVTADGFHPLEAKPKTPL
jgi:cytoskeleton protein RodZ